MRIRTIITVVLATIVYCPAQTGSLTDERDGKTYKTVQIGSQTWMAQNLAYAPSLSYLFLKDNIKETGIYCYADDSATAMEQGIGMLYTWDAAMHSCPAGWHLPGKAEFDTLMAHVGTDKRSVYHALKTGGSSGFEATLGGSPTIRSVPQDTTNV